MQPEIAFTLNWGSKNFHPLSTVIEPQLYQQVARDSDSGFKQVASIEQMTQYLEVAKVSFKLEKCKKKGKEISESMLRSYKIAVTNLSLRF